jgi:hypothetical protein
MPQQSSRGACGAPKPQNIRQFDFVSANSEMANYKALTLAACNGRPVDQIVSLNLKTKLMLLGVPLPRSRHAL